MYNSSSTDSTIMSKTEIMAKTPNKTEKETSMPFFGSNKNSRTTRRIFDRSRFTFWLNLLKSKSQCTRPTLGPGFWLVLARWFYASSFASNFVFNIASNFASSFANNLASKCVPNFASNFATILQAI